MCGRWSQDARQASLPRPTDSTPASQTTAAARWAMAPAGGGGCSGEQQSREEVHASPRRTLTRREQLRTDRPDVGSADGRGSQGGGEDDCRQSCGRQLCGWWWRWRQLSVLQQQVRRTLDPRVLIRPTRQQWHLCRDARQASWTRPTDSASASQTTAAARWLMVMIVDRDAGDNCVAGEVKTPGKHL